MEKEKILVVDDNDDHRNAIQYLLENQGYSVIPARKGKIGLKLLNEHDDIRIIVVDLAMLELSGVQLLEGIRNRRQSLRKIVITGYDEELPFDSAEELEVFSYLNKPISKNTLLFTIKSAFNDLYRENLANELIDISKKWQNLSQSEGGIIQIPDDKVNKIYSKIDSIKEKLQNIGTPLQSKFVEIIDISTQILIGKGKITSQKRKLRKPKVFIGSSTEALEVAQAIELHLKDFAEVTIWKNIFNPGAGILDSLLDSLQKFDFAIFVLGADDFIISRDTPSICPRDNVMFEIGLFMGHLGRYRVFMVFDSSRDIKIASDLTGIVLATYDGNRSDGSLINAVSPTCTQIREAMKKHFG